MRSYRDNTIPRYPILDLRANQAPAHCGRSHESLEKACVVQQTAPALIGEPEASQGFLAFSDVYATRLKRHPPPPDHGILNREVHEEVCGRPSAPQRVRAESLPDQQAFPERVLEESPKPLAGVGKQAIVDADLRARHSKDSSHDFVAKSHRFGATLSLTRLCPWKDYDAACEVVIPNNMVPR